MHVVVVGCGRVGSSLARRLLADGHTVALIDKQASSFEKRFPDGFAGTQVVGFGFDRERLAEAGIERAEAAAAVTSGDNSNIIVARIAKETYQVPNVMARIYDPGRAQVYRRLGIPTVATVEWTTDQALRRLLPNITRAEWIDPSGRVALVERGLPVTFAGRPLALLDGGQRWRIAALTRGGRAQLASPDLVGQEGDVITFIADRQALPDLGEHLAAGPKG